MGNEENASIRFLSGCFSTVRLFVLVAKSGNSLKGQTEKTGKVNSFLKKKENQFQTRWNSKQNIAKEEERIDMISSKKRNVNIY